MNNVFPIILAVCWLGLTIVWVLSFLRNKKSKYAFTMALLSTVITIANILQIFFHVLKK
jgi:hypothetical protein